MIVIYFLLICPLIRTNKDFIFLQREKPRLLICHPARGIRKIIASRAEIYDIFEHHFPRSGVGVTKSVALKQSRAPSDLRGLCKFRMIDTTDAGKKRRFSGTRGRNLCSSR